MGDGHPSENGALSVGKLDDLRAQIDAIDEAILGLLERRANVAEQAAEAKREAGAASYYDPERERAVLDRLASKGAGKFPSQAIRPVFREIMSGCLSLQTPITVVFLGPEGAFSHMAARHLFGLAARYREAATIHGVFDAVRRGDAISGVVPVENSAEGSISHTLDALVDGDLFIRQELVLEASQCLVSRADQLSSIERVYAHPQVLAECQLWLARNLPGAQFVHTSSTSSAAREALADERAAAIGTRLAGELFGLAIVAERIQDRAESATRFVIIAREDAPRTGVDKTTLAFSLHDAGARGALKRALEIFDEEGINLSRIESRPKATTPWEYVFLVDVEGHRQDPPVACVIQKLASRCGNVKVLGSYPRFRFEPPTAPAH
jgi:chorismate mutase / prephenate dehydratase